MDGRFVFILCLFAGVLINIGLVGIGWIARVMVPGLALGVVFWIMFMGAKWLRSR